MTDTEQANEVLSLKEDLKRFPNSRLILILYAFVIGLLYQISYWGVFHLDITPYISLPDILRISVTPLVTVSVLVVLQSATIHYQSRLFYQSNAAGAPTSPKAPRQVLPILILLLIAGFLVVSFLYWNFSKRDLDYLIAGCICGIAVIYLEFHPNIYTQAMPPLQRTVLVVAIVSGTAFSWIIGNAKAKEISDGLDFACARLPADKLVELGLNSSEAELRWLGHVDDYDFFLHEKAVVVVRSDDIPLMTLTAIPHRASLRIPFRDTPRWKAPDQVPNKHTCTS